MNDSDFTKALEGALQFFPDICLKLEQKLCLKNLVIKRKDVLGVLPTGYGKSLIYQLLPKIFSQFWKEKTGETKSFPIIVVSPLELIRTQQVARLTANGINSVSLECCESS